MSNRACAARSTDTRTWPALGAKRRSPPRGNSTPAHPRQPGPKLPRRRSGPTRHRGASRAVNHIRSIGVLQRGAETTISATLLVTTVTVRRSTAASASRGKNRLTAGERERPIFELELFHLLGQIIIHAQPNAKDTKREQQKKHPKHNNNNNNLNEQVVTRTYTSTRTDCCARVCCTWACTRMHRKRIKNQPANLYNRCAKKNRFFWFICIFTLNKGRKHSVSSSSPTMHVSSHFVRVELQQEKTRL
ncbi:hypothetical protein Tsp_03090 [Trichinella spiralis]|uniref:hypothetical protein n=1 Tax=Trichinella spiralis TaxID=6334 RepID=UPI0001EFB9D0|nr:hypothetical protein Tsp_03090 [Trichinella spiralis]